ALKLRAAINTGGVHVWPSVSLSDTAKLANATANEKSTVGTVRSPNQVMASTNGIAMAPVTSDGLASSEERPFPVAAPSAPAPGSGFLRFRKTFTKTHPPWVFQKASFRPQRLLARCALECPVCEDAGHRDPPGLLGRE